VPRPAPYGSWRSPISAALVAGEIVGLGQIACDGSRACWSEQRPRERGRNVIMAATAGGIEEWLPGPYSARTRVHEYGGGAFAVAEGVLFFCHDADQRIWRLALHGAPQPITPEGPFRFADLTFDARRARLYCVREQHVGEREPVNTLVAVDGAGRGPVQVLSAGHDFYSSPRLSGDGRRLAWLAWNHPDMPWDATELWLADIAEDGTLANPRRVAGGHNESICQPQFAPDGALYFVSDRRNWWNLYRWRAGAVECVCETAAEFAVPHWVFGQSNYAFVSAEQAICAYGRDGTWQLGLLDAARGELTAIDAPYTEVSQLCAHDGRAWFVGAAPARAAELVELDVASRQMRVVRRASSVELDPGFLSTPRAIDYPTGDGLRAHAFYYPPRNRDFVAPDGEAASAPSVARGPRLDPIGESADASSLARGPRLDPIGERPPLLVLSHGGPTAAASSALNLRVQYFTSRGFAVLDVNYRGSTGFGRAYRRALNGQWGVADVEDCVAGARHLVEQGLADPARLAIRGGSAGGYTTLCALTWHDVFKAGASYYGISDLEALVRDTHKFEARYLDRLVGPYPAERALYQARSPIHHVERLACPMIFFQGLLDKVTPPDQTERMVQALRRKGIAVAYVAFDDEAHGFRRAENVERALAAEFAFYARVFGFTPAEELIPLDIENL
jgi:dipeptidyl aminopeptidase/acylaminoacyl peptidase